MTSDDTALIEALGWDLCVRRDGVCATHFGYVFPHRITCTRMTRRLEAARDGIELARNGIADTLANTRIRSCIRAEATARRWQP